jgi:hypothetical protein
MVAWLVMGLLAVASPLALWATIEAYRNRPEWGVARRMGITKKIKSWCDWLYRIAIADAALIMLVSALSLATAFVDVAIPGPVTLVFNYSPYLFLAILFPLVVGTVVYTLSARRKLRLRRWVGMMILPVIGLPVGCLQKTLRAASLRVASTTRATQTLTKASSRAHSARGAVRSALVAASTRSTRCAAFEKSIDHVVDVTKRQLGQEQRRLVMADFQNNLYVDAVVDTAARRAKFASSRERLRQEWALHTGTPWPVQNGRHYDAHHLVPLAHGGPNKWYNLHPVVKDVHGSLIHAKDSPTSALFPASLN